MSLVIYTQKASQILSSVYLIYSSFSLHIKDIIELGRTEESRFIRECDMLKNKVHLGNTMGDCFEDKSGIILYYLEESLERKKTLFPFSLQIKFGLLSLSSGL